MEQPSYDMQDRRDGILKSTLFSQSLYSAKGRHNWETQGKKQTVKISHSITSYLKEPNKKESYEG
jgi:hypothetical protein